MIKYKDELKNSLDNSQIFELLRLWGGEPEYHQKGIVSRTICHNDAGEGSHKLYYYDNSHLFKCYTECSESFFDIFQLCIKVKEIQENIKWNLRDAIVYIAGYFGFIGLESKEQGLGKYWNVFKRHDFTRDKTLSLIQLREFDDKILNIFTYPRILPWEKEGISPKVIQNNHIGYYPTNNQITIPHFDINNKLIGVRGRTLGQEEAIRFGKYCPIKVNKQLYNHPLGLNLYNLNNSKENISKLKTAIVFEGEKSTLLAQTYYGKENDISVACCGSFLSRYQFELLRSLGVREIILAFDRQFLEPKDAEYYKLRDKLISLYRTYGHLVKITAIFDIDMLTPYKASPIDISKEIFEELLIKRVVPYG